MEDPKGTELSHWVEERLELLAPPSGWEPNAYAAQARLEARMKARPRAGRYWAMGTATACLAMAVMLVNPSVRAFAQQMWQRMRVGRIDVVRVDFDSLPDEARSLRAQAIQKPVLLKAGGTVAEDAALAGFTARLPHAGVLAGEPKLAVLGPMSYGTTLKAADVELALRSAGVTDQAVPREWDGAQIAVQIGATVSAGWPDDTSLMQGLPPVVSTPSGFDLGGFMAAVLRAAGMNRAAAEQYGRRLAASPAMLFGIGGQEKVRIQDVRLRTGPGTVIEDFDDDTGARVRVAVIWSVPDRLYLLSGNFSVERAMAVANAVE